MPRIAINIVTWNSADYIDQCLQAVYAQTNTDFAVTIVDNASADATLAVLEPWQQAKKITLIRNATNAGYAPAHNKAIHATQSEFVLTLNPDAILEPRFLEAMLAVMEQYPQVGSAAGKLIRISPAEFAARTDIENCVIDSAGLIMRRNRRQELRGILQNAGNFGKEGQLIFGADGAAAFYRRAMLEDTAYQQEYFDEDFVTHKEDIDLAWRAQLLGWQSYYTPHAIAYHIRGFKPGERTEMPPKVKRDAVKNRWLLSLKNEIPRLFLRDLHLILLYELKILGYMLLFERTSLPAMVDALRLVKPMLKKRQGIHHKRRVDAAYMKQFFV